MNLFCVKADKTKRSPLCFTLIELLVVVALMALILAAGMPAFEKLTIGSGVDAATRQLNAQLRLARQYAISHRCKVALIMPTNEIGGNARWACFRPAVVTGTASPFDFSKWVEGTTWSFLPVGTSIMEADDDVGIRDESTVTKDPKDNTVLPSKFQQVGTDIHKVDLKTLKDGTTTVKEVRAVVFSSTGRLANMDIPLYVTLGEAVNNGTAGNNGNWIIRKPANSTYNESASNQLTIKISPYTGRTITFDPSEYEVEYTHSSK